MKHCKTLTKKSKRCLVNNKRSETFSLDDNLIHFIATFLDYDDVIRLASVCTFFRKGCERILSTIRKIVTGLLSKGFIQMSRSNIMEWIGGEVFRLELDLAFGDENDEMSIKVFNKLSMIDKAKYVIKKQFDKHQHDNITYFIYEGERISRRSDLMWIDFYFKGLAFTSSSFGYDGYIDGYFGYSEYKWTNLENPQYAIMSKIIDEIM